MGPLGIITGLTSETACLGGITDPARCRVRCAGADAHRAGVLARELVGQGCSALLSFGLAGGLDPQLSAGHVVLGVGVMADGARTFSSDATWLERSRAGLAAEMPVARGTLVGVAVPVTTAKEKRRLYAATGAAALDVESHAVATAADESGIPFLAIRVVADTASQSVPRWLPAVIDNAGAVRLATFAGGLLTHPGDTADVFRLAAANRRAMASLRRVAALLGPGFGLL